MYIHLSEIQRKGDYMSKREQALKEYEKFEQRERYWEKIFAKMKENQKEGVKLKINV